MSTERLYDPTQCCRLLYTERRFSCISLHRRQHSSLPSSPAVMFTWTSSTIDRHRCSQIATNHDSRRHANGTATFGSRGLLQQAAGRIFTQPDQPHLQQKECSRWTDEGGPYVTDELLLDWKTAGPEHLHHQMQLRKMWFQESTVAHTIRWFHYDALGCLTL